MYFWPVMLLAIDADWWILTGNFLKLCLPLFKVDTTIQGIKWLGLTGPFKVKKSVFWAVIVLFVSAGL